MNEPGAALEAAIAHVRKGGGPLAALMPPETAASPPRRLYGLAALAAVVVPALLTWWLQTGHGGGPLPGCQQWACDFSRHYYPTFRALPLTGAPTDGFLYPPFFALLGVPVGMLALPAAMLAWAVVQAGSLYLLARAPLETIEEATGSRAWPLVYLALLAGSMTVVDHLVWGQVGTLLTGLVVMAVVLERRGHRTAAAACLGAAVAIKYYPAMFLAWWLLRRDWRFVGLTAAWAVGFTLLPATLLGPSGLVAFFRASAGELAGMGDVATVIVVSQSWLAVLGRLSAYFSPVAFSIAVWGPVVAVLLLGAAVAFLRAARDDRPLLGLGLLFGAFPFLGSVVWQHHLVYAPLLQAVALAGAQRLGHGAWRAATLLAGASVVVGSVQLAAAVDPAIQAAVGLPLLASVLALAGLVVVGLGR